MKLFYLALFATCIMFTSQAAIIVVDRADDLMNGSDGGCDLRDAVAAANFNFSIEGCIAGSTSGSDVIIIGIPGPIQLSNEIDILTSIAIYPTFANTDNVTINAADNERIFEVHPTLESSNDFEMARLNLIGGDAGTSDGGAVVFYRFNDKDLGDIYISDCVFEDNQANFGGAIAFVDTFADSITMLRNNFTENQGSFGGALSASNATKGEFNLTLNQFNMNNAVLNPDSNTATGGAAFIIDSSPETYTISKNQFLENNSEDSAGALDLRGFNVEQNYHLDQNVFLYNHADDFAGALTVGPLGRVDIYNSTFAYNTANRGGALVYLNGKIYIRQSTIVYNDATQFGSNIYSFNGTGQIRSSIIAYPVSGNNCAGTFNLITSSTRNVMDDISCPNSASFDTIADPLLSDFTVHPSGLSGFIPTINSAAIDYVPVASCLNFDSSIMTEDQQGNPRPIDGNDDGIVNCDSGAIEAPLYVNQPAVANNDSPPAITEDSNAATIDVLANDTDNGGGPFFVIAKTNGSNGMVVITNNGNDLSYTPDDDFCGSDFFTYTITGNDTATVNILVVCVNDAPDFSVNQDFYIKLDELNNLPTLTAACLYNYGPDNENSNQSISDFSVNIASDPQNIINTVDVENNGMLVASFSGNQGVATINVTLIDNGGTANGGVNSLTKQVNIHVHDYLFRNGLETEVCQ